MAESSSDAKPAEQITILIKQESEAALKMKVKSSTKFSKIFQAFFTNKGISKEGVTFQFEGVNVEEDATPESLGLEEGATIDVMIKQTGGS